MKTSFSLVGILTIAALLALLAGFLEFDRNLRWAFGETDPAPNRSHPAPSPHSNNASPTTGAELTATPEPTAAATSNTLTAFDRIISPGAWGLGWQTFAAPLPIGRDALMLFAREDQRAVVWRIDWASRSAQSVELPALQLGDERYAAAAGKEGTWLVGPHLALIRSDGGAIVRGGFGADHPMVFALPDGGALALVAGKNTPARLLQLSLGAMDDLRIEDRGPLPHGRQTGYAATVLTGGRLMVAGGDRAPTAVDLYDVRTDRWQPAAPLPNGRVGALALALPDGRAVVAGAGKSFGEGSHKAWEWEPRSDRWQALPDLPWGLRISFPGSQTASGAVLPDGGLVFGGGMDNALQVLARQGDGWAARWRVVSSGSFQRAGGVVQPLSNDRVAVAGGIFTRPGAAAGCCTQAGVDEVLLGEKPNPASAALGLARDRPVLALQGRELFVAGGIGQVENDIHRELSALVEHVDLVTGAVRQIAPLPAPIGPGQAEWLDRDRLVVKGDSWTLAIYDRHRDAWRNLTDVRLLNAVLAGILDGDAILFDADGQGWTVSPNDMEVNEFPRLNLARTGGIGRVLADGRIVVAAGVAASTVVSVIDPDCDGDDCPERYVGFGEKSPAARHEIYSPRTRNWQLSAGSEIVPFGTAILADGSVVHAGRSEAGGGQFRILRSSPDGQSWSDLPLPQEMSPPGRHDGPPCSRNEGMNSCRLAVGRSPDDGGDLLFLRQVDQSDRHWRWDDQRKTWQLLDGQSGAEPLPWIEMIRADGQRWRVGGLDSGKALIWPAN